ncbi:MAG TPA: SDR family oxidoreductase, partial [Solirubrobacteraceae bacterium]|nr:SDR family oxidoreductase [Solirubrobacteraceae bacterium]
MSYFVTGATGFIGRHLVERLLEREGDIHVLVREGSTDKLEGIMRGWGSPDRINHLTGDLSEPMLGLSESDRERLKRVDHFFHLAAIYDMTADEDRNAQLNVGGTQNAVDLANALEAGIFHHASSIAVAGVYEGHFTEDSFYEGQKLIHPYHRTKFEAEKLVRQQVKGAWRVYRPSIVVGNSKTGEMDKTDGPYYFFKAIQKARFALPQWFPLVGLEFGKTNIVPVDYVAAAMDHIAHLPDLDGRAFHLVNPKAQKAGDVINTFARAAHAPQLVMRVDKGLTDMLPKGVLSYAMKLPALKDVRRTLLADLGIPDSIVEYVGLTASFDARDTQRALQGSGIELPQLDVYADKLWDYWERNLDPDLFKDRSFQGAVNGRTAIITGASSGIGKAAARKIAAAGGIPILVARTMEKLEEVKAEIERDGGTAYAYSCDLSDMDSIDATLEQIFSEHASIDMLVNNAGRSIRRSVAVSYDRFHDYERTIQLNYLGAVKLILGVLPHMREKKFGHVVNVSSIGVQTNPPRFSAYVASKAALDAFTRV